MTSRAPVPVSRRIVHGAGVVVGSVASAAACFLVLPLIQAIGGERQADLELIEVETANVPPPPPPPEDEPEEEPEPEEPPPELVEEAPPLDLSQLELALNPGIGGGGWSVGDFGLDRLQSVAARGKAVEALFSLAELDQKPRPIHQTSPSLSPALRAKTPGQVYVLFVVERSGRVQEARVQKSTDPALEKPALEAVRRWRFEPGKRNGEPVRFRMRVPISFPKDRP